MLYTFLVYTFAICFNMSTSAHRARYVCLELKSSSTSIARRCSKAFSYPFRNLHESYFLFKERRRKVAQKNCLPYARANFSFNENKSFNYFFPTRLNSSKIDPMLKKAFNSFWTIYNTLEFSFKMCHVSTGKLSDDIKECATNKIGVEFEA